MNEQPLLAHLIELRQRLVRALVGFFVVFLLLFHWSGSIYHLLARPLLQHLPAGSNMIAIEVTAPFFVPLKVTMLVALLISLPNTLYQIWAFIAPGLYSHEKRLVLPLVVSSVLLFCTGMAFAYFLVFPLVFTFMAAVTPSGVAMMTDIDKYLSFVIGMFIAFGAAFEVPVVVVLLVRIGVLTVKKLRQGRPYVIVGAFVVAAIVTPPDVLSQTMLAVPLCLLYEIGIIAAMVIERRRAQEAAANA
jgi:sec-independent protein translocase protein TatC